MMAKNTPMLTRLSFEGKGGLTQKQTLYSAKQAKEDSYMPLKSSDYRMLNVKKYGGFMATSTAYFFLVEYEVDGKKVRTLEMVPNTWKDRIEKNENMLLKYCTEVLKLENPSIRLKKIKLQSYIKKDGYFMYLSGRSEDRITVKNAVQLCMNSFWMKYIREVEKTVEMKRITEKISYEENMKLYKELCEKYNNGIYSKRPTAVGEKLKGAEQAFAKISLYEQCIVISQILALSRIENPSADLTLIGLSKQTGTMKISKNITNCKEYILINQSVTGLFEQKVDLLTV